ncbi:MAG: L,D-transpeptidase family protein [Chakrabartia sp.]
MASLFASEGARLAAAAPQSPRGDVAPVALPPAPGPVALPQAEQPSPGPAATSAAAPEEAPQPAPHWALSDATSLLGVIQSVGKRGLLPADYEPAALKAALAAGEGPELDALATRLFTMLAGDLRDGRTPITARGDWFVDDTDAETLPLDIALQVGLESHDIEGALARLEPKHPDYAALKAELAKTPASNSARIAQLRANLDRWRWLPQALGVKHLLANIPEYMVRVNTFGRNIAAYRVIVGKLDTPTPQLSAPAVGIVVHPPWVLPQSIIRQEVGPLIARNPAQARARGYVWTGEGKTLSVVQKPGPTAALGQLKIDMPNPHAIFLHDTPNKALFANNPRAYSHGCLRTERAFELGILLSLLQSGQRLDDADARNKIADNLVQLIRAGDTAKAPFKEPIPVYIAYFTLSTAGGATVQSFPDLYGWDAPVVRSFAKSRKDLLLPPPPPVQSLSPAG